MSDISGDESNDLELDYTSSGSSSSDDLDNVFPGEGTEEEERVVVPDYQVEFGLYEPLADMAEEHNRDDDDDEMEIDENRLIDMSWWVLFPKSAQNSSSFF